MRRRATRLFGVAGAAWLLTCGFLGSPGQAFAQDAAQQKAQEAQKAAQEARQRMLMAEREIMLKVQLAQNDAVVQRFEQQFAPQFRQLYRTELHFMRVVCQPTKQQYEKISADGEPALKATIKDYAGSMRRPSASGQPNPRTPIVDAIAKSVRTTLSPEQAGQYQKELDQRAAARKRVVLLNLVAKIDIILVLTIEQRAKLGEILEASWNDSWDHTRWLMLDSRYFPQLPDARILALLTETQRSAWRGIPKGNVRLGMDLSVIQWIEIEDEVWDEDRPGEKSEQAESKSAVADKKPTKPIAKE